MKVLVSAYACEPEKGSEPAVGWHWARQLAERHEVWVITRSNNRERIERALVGHVPNPQLTFLYTDLPPWARRWKRGQRGARLYSYLWQFAALREAIRAHRSVGFDLVHHVTFASAYRPALVCMLPVPFVWGPVGGGPHVPWRFARELGLLGVGYEGLRSFRRLAGRYLDPFVRLTWMRADRILVQNTETLHLLPRRHRGKALVCPNAGSDPAEVVPRIDRGESSVIAIVAGRLQPWKGASLAMRAIAAAARRDLRLVVAGEGPNRRRLERLAASLGISSRVEFVGWLPQGRLFELLSRSDVLLMPSLREDCGFIVVEAMAHGVVPFVLGSGGPPLLVGETGFVSVANRPAQVVAELADALALLCDEPRAREEASRAAAERALRYSWGELWTNRLSRVDLFGRDVRRLPQTPARVGGASG